MRHFIESLEQTLTGVSLKSGKSTSAISFFFNHAKWTAADLKNKMQQILKNREETRPQKSDVICLDGSALAKDGETFEKQTKVFDNADKKGVTGYELCAASVLTLSGIKYVFLRFLSHYSDFCSLKSWKKVEKVLDKTPFTAYHSHRTTNPNFAPTMIHKSTQLLGLLLKPHGGG